MSPEIDRPTSEVIYASRDALKEYALLEQDRINSLNLVGEERLKAFGDLALDLNKSCPFMHEYVQVRGERVIGIPEISDESNNGSIDVSDAHIIGMVRNVLDPDETTGKFYGYSVKTVHELDDTLETVTRSLVCSVVLSNYSFSEFDEEGNLVTTTIAHHYPLEHSELTLFGDYNAHDIRKLRESNQEIFEDIDWALYGKDQPMGETMKRLYGMLKKNKFKDLPDEDKLAVISYVNSFDLLKPLQKIQTSYAFTDAGGVITFDQVPVLIVFNRFTIVNDFKMDDSNPYYPMFIDLGASIGAVAKFYYEDKEYEITIPIGQGIRFLDIDK